MPDRDRDVLKSALGRTDACPDIETLSAAAGNPAVQQHLEACSHCRTELAMLREFAGAEPQAHELASVNWIEGELRRRMPELSTLRPPASVSLLDKLRMAAAYLFAPQRWRMLSMAALSLLVVVAAGVYFRQSGQAPLPAPNRPPVWRSGQFAAASPAGDVTETPTEFRWEAVTGAVSYHLQVMEVDGSVIWSGGSDQTRIEIPQTVRAVMKPGRAFEWKVMARNAARENIASTDLQTFHILATSH